MPFSIVEKILNVHRGTRFIKADLHIHTPASSDWDEKNSEEKFKSDKIEPEQIVDAAIAAGVELIAITDHNSVEWCERVINAVGSKPLVVLPGFELTVNPGVHILAIFEQDKNIDELRDLLIKLGINRGQFGDAKAQTEAAITDHQNEIYSVVKKIADANGIAIPAHIENDSGIIGRIKGGMAVKEFLEKSGCRILEVTKEKLPEVVAQLLQDNPRRFALLRNSDAHRLDMIGSRSTWLKLDPMPDRNQKPKYLDSLKQIGFEPITRVRHSNDDPSKKAQVIGFYTNGGVLRDQTISFNEQLNCIIGGRGAGKSALLDYLRFVLGDEPDADELKQKLRKRYTGLIENSTTVYVLVEDANDDFWLYERTLEYDSEKHRGRPDSIVVTSPKATKYQVFIDKREVVKFGDDTDSFSVDFYGQGEVQSITNQAETSRQLKLIDNFVSASINQRENKIEECEQELDEIETLLDNAYSEQIELHSRIESLDELKSRISEIEASLEKDIFKTHQIWADADHWIETAITHLNHQSVKLSQLKIDPLEKKDFPVPNAESLIKFQSLQGKILSALTTMAEGNSKLKNEITEFKTEIDKLKIAWADAFYKQKDEYTAKLREQGVSNLEILNKELAQKRRESEDIQQKDVPALEKTRVNIKELEGKRKKTLKELHDAYSSIRDCRIAAAKEMTSRLRREIKIEISNERTTTLFYEQLDAATPSGTQTSVLNQVINTFTPQEFVAIVKAKDINPLLTCGLSENAAQRMLSTTPKDLLRLERVRCDDIAIIQLRIDDTYRNLGELSEGEKCTAILSIILLDENRPLVIDQPEDELDHDFIMSNVVNILADVKQCSDQLNSQYKPRTGRQFIIATHNQNIPVLGNAELVIRMQKIKGSEQCEVLTAYGLEHPETIQQVLSLEGGKGAFERRRQKYFIA